MNRPMRLAGAIALACGTTLGGMRTAAADPPRWASAHGWHQKHHPPVHAYPAYPSYRTYPPPAYYGPPRAYFGPPPVYYAPPPWPPVIVFGATIW